jgi:hypothetical protein
LDDCDLSGAVFEETDLTGADLRSARNFLIDPTRNRIKGAHFDLHGLPGPLGPNTASKWQCEGAYLGVAMNVYAFITPLVILLLLLEIVYSTVARKGVYNFQDTITNLGTGIGNQCINLGVAFFVYTWYGWLYQFAPWQIPTTWYSVLGLLVISDFVCLLVPPHRASGEHLLGRTHAPSQQRGDESFGGPTRKLHPTAVPIPLLRLDPGAHRILPPSRSTPWPPSTCCSPIGTTHG